MIESDQYLSESAKRFYKVLTDNAPELLQFVAVVSPSDKYPCVDPNSLVMTIPARDGFIFDALYVETRREDILIEMGVVPHLHFSWWSEDVVDEQMLKAVQLIRDILNERMIFVKKQAFLTGKEHYDIIRIEALGKKKDILAVYSWKGTYNN